MGKVLAGVTAGPSMAQIRYVAPVRRRGAPERVNQVYRQVIADFGMLAPPVAVHAPVPVALAAGWTILRESLLAGGALARPVKEVIAAAVSSYNTCPYCVQIHGLSLTGQASAPDARATLGGDHAGIDDRELRSAALWATATGVRGDAAIPPMATAEQRAEALGVALTFHYLNRIVNVFLPPSPIPPGLPAIATGPVARVAGRILGAQARRSCPAGTSLDLLPPADLPPELAALYASGHVGTAFARAAAAMDSVGIAFVPAPVRSLVEAELAAWDGTAPGLGRSWLIDAVSGLAPADRAAGRLALLVAMASYRVTGADIDAARPSDGVDAGTVGLVSWAAMAATRRIAGWSSAGAV